MNPSARSEGFCVGIGATAPDHEDAGSCCAAGAGSLDSVAGSAIGPTPVPTGPALALSSANAFANRTRHASVCGPKPTQPLQPGVASCLATNLVVKYTRRCPDGPWSCCVTIVAFKFSDLPFQGSPRTFFNSLIRNLSSGGHAAQRFCFSDSILRVVCHWRPANPDSMAPSPIQIACWHGRVPVHHSFSEWQHLARVCFPKNTHKCSSSGSSLRDESVARQFSCRRFSSESHIARQIPLITRFAFSILPRL